MTDGKLCVGPEFAFDERTGALDVRQIGSASWSYPSAITTGNGLNSTASGLYTAPHMIIRHTDSQGGTLSGPVALAAVNATYTPTTASFTITNPSPCSRLRLHWWFQANIAVTLPAGGVAEYNASLGVGAPAASPARLRNAWNPANAQSAFTWYDRSGDHNYSASGTDVPPLGSTTLYPTVVITNLASAGSTVLAWGTRTMVLGVLVDLTQAGSTT